MLLEIQELTPRSTTKTEMLAISCVHNLLACIANVALPRYAEPCVSSWRCTRATREPSVYITDYPLKMICCAIQLCSRGVWEKGQQHCCGRLVKSTNFSLRFSVAQFPYPGRYDAMSPNLFEDRCTCVAHHILLYSLFPTKTRISRLLQTPYAQADIRQVIKPCLAINGNNANKYMDRNATDPWKVFPLVLARNCISVNTSIVVSEVEVEVEVSLYMNYAANVLRSAP